MGNETCLTRGPAGEKATKIIVYPVSSVSTGIDFVPVACGKYLLVKLPQALDMSLCRKDQNCRRRKHRMKRKHASFNEKGRLDQVVSEGATRVTTGNYRYYACEYAKVLAL